MDITPFINSVDIADNLDFILREEDADDLPVKCAWLIWQSNRVSLREKHDAWRIIIETMPDCHLPLRGGSYEGSLHTFLNDYMDYERSLVETFQHEENNTLYAYHLHDASNEYPSCDGYHFSAFPTLSQCFYVLQNKCGKDSKVKRITITKRWLDNKERYIVAAISTKSWKLVNIHGTGFVSPASLQTFNWMWFDFPTPFRRGDILVSSDGVPFVLERICTWLPFDPCWESKNDPPKRMPTIQNVDLFREYGSITDMHCHSYFISESGHIFYDQHPHNYMNLEYYRGEFVGHQRILHVVSNYMNDKISLDELLNAYVS